MSPFVASRTCVELVEELEQQESNCHFRINQHGTCGVHVMAVHDMDAGTVITRSVALSHKLLLQHNHVTGSSSSDNNDDHNPQQCAYCLSSPNKLFRCSSCKDIRYCGKNCQRGDFVQHKHECKYLRERRTTVITDLEKESQIADVDEICLLLRTYGALMKLKESKSLCQWKDECLGHTSSKKTVRGTFSCGYDHWKQMAMVPPELVHVPDSTLTTVCKFTSWSTDEIIQVLRVFQANNFGVLNDLYETVAQGVYPHAAMLNHSCDPTCFLRFHKSTSAVPVLEIVAIRDVRKGEELTHSYVDLVSSTRRQQLQDLHGFVCSCRRCQGLITVSLPLNHIPHHSDFYDWILNQKPNHEDQHMIQSQHERRNDCADGMTNTVAITVDEALVSYGTSYNKDHVSRCLKSGQELMQEARLCIQHDNLEGELASLVQAIAVMKGPGNPPLSRDLYQAHGMYLSCLLVHCSDSGNTALKGNHHLHDHFVQEAEMACRAMVAFLCVAMPSNHPLLGLQLFTLGDLTPADDNDNKKNRNLFYSWSRDILRKSHGEQHDLVRRLNGMISQGNDTEPEL